MREWVADGRRFAGVIKSRFAMAHFLPAVFAFRRLFSNRSAAVLLLLLLLAGHAGRAQSVADYSFGAGGGPLVDMSGATAALGAGQNNAASAVLNLGFTFKFGSTNYTQFSVATNGSLRFGSTVIVPGMAFPASGNTPGLAPLTGPYNTGNNGGVRYQVFGSSPNRQLVVEWNLGLNVNSPADRRFQASLREGSNAVNLSYAGGYTHNSSGSGAGAGIATSATVYQCVDLGTGTSTTTSVPEAAGKTITARQAYTFAPPPVITSFSPTSGPVGTNVSVVGTGMTGVTAARVNGTAGTITSATDGGLDFTVEAGSTTGPVSVVAGRTTVTGGNFTVTLPAPAVTSVAVPANGTYGISSGNNLRFTVNFDQAVTVNLTGFRPKVNLTLAASPLMSVISYQSGSGSTALVFQYSVLPGDFDPDGIQLANAIRLAGSTIRNSAGTDADLTLRGVASLTGVLIDGIDPTATLASTAGASTRSSPIPVTLTFSEPVTGFTLSDLSITNGTASGLSGSGANYAFNVTPSSSGNPPGTVTVNLPGGRAFDAAGNSNAAAAALSRTYDTQAPTLTFSGPAGSTSTSPIPLTATFSEDVTGFALIDLLVGNGTASGLAGGPRVYTFSVTPAASGTVTLSALAGEGQDAAGNNSAASNTYSVAYAPPVAVSDIIPSPRTTNAASAGFLVTFGGDVRGAAASNFALTASAGIVGASITSVGSGRNTCSVLVDTGSGSGTLRLDVVNGTGIVPTLSNVPYTGGTLLTVDKTVPTVGLSSTAPNPTRTSPIPVTVTFSEPVTGFTLSDLTLSNGTAGNLLGSGANYTFDLTPTANGVVTVQVNAASAADAAGNASTASTTLARTFDNVVPTATLASPAGAATRTSPVPITLSFSEAVTGLALTDLTVSGGTLSNLTGSGSSYAFDLVPSGSGTPPSALTLWLSSATVTDAAGNANGTGNALNLTYDTQAPTVSLASTAPATTNTSPIPVTVVFSEAVTGFTLIDLTPTNATASNLTGSGANYSFNLTPAAVGTVAVSVNAGAAQDAATNPSTASASLSRIYSNVGPTVTLSSTAGASTNASPIPVTVLFSAAVTGFTLSDIAVSNGTAGGFSGSGASYSFTITPAADGAVTAQVAAGVAQDVATNGNAPSNLLSRIYDTLAPGLTLATTAALSTNTSTFAVTATFTESVGTSFTLSDIAVSNGTASALSGSSGAYSFTVTASGTGNPASPVTVGVAAGAAQDAATNPSTASNALARTFDTQAPVPTLASTAPATTPTSPIPVTLTFPEDVTGLTLSDVSVTNGTATSLTGSNRSYAFNVVPTGPGLVTVSLGANAVQDAATNPSPAAADLTRTYQPAAAISSSSPAVQYTNATTASFTVLTSAAVTGWMTSNFSLSASGVTGASLAGVSASGNTVTVTVNTGSGDGTLRLNVATASGLAPTLNNVPYTSGSLLTIDRTAPTVLGVSDGSAYNTDRTITFADANPATATLNGTAFASGMLLSAEGNYSLVVTDGAGNSTTVNFIIDKTPPDTFITAGPGSLTNDNTPAFTFNSPDGGILYATTGGPGLTYPNNGANSTFGVLADGTYTLTVAAIDAAGNQDPTPASYTFTVNTVVSISGFAPTSGPVGTSITVTGYNLAGATAASVGGTAGTVTANTSTSLTFVVGAGSATGTVRVATPGGTATGGTFAVTVPPMAVTGLAPTRNARNAAPGSTLAVTFSQPLANTAATRGSVKVFSQQRGGRLTDGAGAAARVISSTILFDPTTDFKPGETVSVTATTAATAGTEATLAVGQVSQFTVATSGTGVGNFVAPALNPEPAVGYEPQVLALGDVNGDGHLDLLVANIDGGTVSVRLNSGLGNFTAPAANPEPAVGSGPSSLVLGDVDGDGDLDFVTANVVDNTLSVRLNDGLGGFTAPATNPNPAVGTYPLGLALGDVDGDGDLDLVVANRGDNTVSTRLNNGLGSFTAPAGPASFAVGDFPQALALGDVDGDGDLDFVTANRDNNTVSVRLNQVAAPALAAFSPAAELPGQPVVISGTGFTPASTVTFGGTPAGSVTYVSPTSLTATVPASAAAGSAAVVVSTANGSSISSPAFAVLSVYSGGTPDACTAALPGTVTVGDGAWHYLLSGSGQVVAAYNYTGASLGDFAADVLRAGLAAPVRQDGRGRKYLDRNWHLTASGGPFAGRTVGLRLYGLASELARLQAADPAASLAGLKATQYSGANEDCALANDDFAAGQFRTLAAPASQPAGTAGYFVAELAVADHFSEFYLTSSSTPLPVELVSFTAVGQGPAVRLAWATASEKNSLRFDVERSADGQQFARIAEVAAQSTATSPTAYAWRDRQPLPGLAYYRLRQVDRDGAFAYSPVRTVTRAGTETAALAAWPVPARAGQPLTVRGAAGPLTLFEALGRVVARAVPDATGSAVLALPAGLPPGVYVLRAGAQARRVAVE